MGAEIVLAAIRPATESDGEAILRLVRQFATSYLTDVEAFQDNFPRLIRHPGAIVLVADVQEEVAGYVVGFEFPTLFANGPILELTELSVEEEIRGHGVGSQLVQAALQLASLRGCVEAVVPTRRAGPFYERLGFARTAEYYKLRLPNR